MSKVQAEVVQRLTLPATIDGHKPLVVTWRIKGDDGWFRLTVVTVNWGRGYGPGEFHRNVMNVLNKVGEREYVVIIMQEIDEADSAPEHKIIREDVEKEMEPGTQYVQWWTREPIIVSRDVEILRQGKSMTMDQGSTIGYKGLGPKRFITWALLNIEGVRIGIANQHPHRYSQRNHKGVAGLLDRGERVTRRVLGMLLRVADMEIDGGDLNTAHYPLSVKGQKIAYHRDLDYLRFTLAA